MTAIAPGTGDVPAKTKKKGPSLWLSILVFLLGAVFFAIGGGIIFSNALEAISEDAFDTPGSLERELEATDYNVFGSIGSISDRFARASFTPDDVIVTRVATGEIIPVEGRNTTLTLGRGTTSFDRVGVFTVDEPGTYIIEIGGSRDSQAVVARTFSGSFAGLGLPLILAIVGPILLVLGVIMLIVGIIRRSRAAKAERQANMPGPPGGFQQFPGQQYPGQPYPGQTQQYPGQPYPGQTQQYPGQPYPGQTQPCLLYTSPSPRD